MYSTSVHYFRTYVHAPSFSRFLTLDDRQVVHAIEPTLHCTHGRRGECYVFPCALSVLYAAVWRPHWCATAKALLLGIVSSNGGRGADALYCNKHQADSPSSFFEPGFEGSISGTIVEYVCNTVAHQLPPTAATCSKREKLEGHDGCHIHVLFFRVIRASHIFSRLQWARCMIDPGQKLLKHVFSLEQRTTRKQKPYPPMEFRRRHMQLRS